MKSAAAPGLPNFNEFSTGSIGTIGRVLEVAVKFEGSRKQLVDGIIAAFPKIAATPSDKQRRVRANNVLIGMSQCGLFSLEDNRLTTVGRELAGIADVGEQDRRFAALLLSPELPGMQLLDAVRSIRGRGEAPSKKRIASELRSRGFKITTNSGDPGKMRAWLQRGGVVDSNWVVDEGALKKLMGLDTVVYAEWETLSRPQRAFADTVREVSGPADGGSEWLTGSHVKRLCELRFGAGTLPEDMLRSRVLDPLEERGYIETKGKGGGRGGKIGDVRATRKLLEPVASLPVESKSRIPPELRALRDTPLEKIRADLKSDDPHTKGIALELLALRIVRDLGLQEVAFRERGVETGGAEVDLIADGVHLHYSRWLFQCKATSSPRTRVSLSALAKEVGMAVMLRAHVIVIVTTGAFAASVPPHARRLAKTGVLQSILVDNEVLERYRTGGGLALVEYFSEQAGHTLQLKRTQLRRLPR